MYRLSDKESTYLIIKWCQPIAWITLSNNSENEVTEALVKRAYAAVSCRNPLLRAVYKPEVERFSLLIRDVSEIVQDEADGKLPVHFTRKFRTRDEVWAEYEKKIETEFWESDFMWEVIFCALDSEVSPGPKYAIIAQFNHGVTDGAAVMKTLGEFVDVLNAGLASSDGGGGASLPAHNFLGESLPIPRTFLERYPPYKFTDTVSDDEKDKLFSEVSRLVRKDEFRVYSAIATKTFDEKTSQKFIEKCKINNVSVTAGLFAAVALTVQAKKKFDAAMPLSFRSKDNWGDLAVGFTDAGFSLDLASAWEENSGKDEDTLWAAIAKEFHREIRRKFSSDEEKYRGMAVTYLREVMKGPAASRPSMCSGPGNDEFSMCLSNVGVLDGYFRDEKISPLNVEDVMGFCTNFVYCGVTFWCYTFRGMLRICLLDATLSPKRREAFDVFSGKVFDFIGKYEGK